MTAQLPPGKGRRRAAALALAFAVAAGIGLATASEVALVQQGGVYMVPVRINDAMTLNFVLDSGAAEVQIPLNIVRDLLRSGSIAQSDLLPGRVYQLADGSQVMSQRLLIRQMHIGTFTVKNVSASVGAARGPSLIGQSLLSRFPTWSLDNRRHRLILGNDAVAESAPEVSDSSPIQVTPGREVRPDAAPAPRPAARPAVPETPEQKRIRALCERGGAAMMLNCPDNP